MTHLPDFFSKLALKRLFYKYKIIPLHSLFKQKGRFRSSAGRAHHF